MPVYAYRCPSCEHEFDLILPLSRYDEPQSCPECSTAAKKRITAPMFNLVGDDWPGKANRVNNQMAEKNKRVSARQRVNHGTPATLVPNVDGERTSSWSDAAKLAKDKGKDTSGYERMATAENAKKA
jgi:putative FmdB family regulatory protein